MHGYDTVVCAVAQQGKPDLPWRWVDRRDVRDGGVSVRALAPLEQVQVSYHELATLGGAGFSELRVQASLPKVLWGTNTRELTEREEFEKAVDGVSSAVSAFLGQQVDVSSWALRRVDVTGDVVLSSEELVQAALDRLAYQRIRGKLPTRGESRSVSWPSKNGGYTRKAYSKYREFLSGKDASGLVVRDSLIVGSKVGPATHYSDALAAARGRLRVEVGCLGQKAVKRAGIGKVGEVVTVDRLVGPYGERFRERVMRPFLGRIGRVVEEVDVEAWEAFQRFKGSGKRSNRAASLVGYAFVIQRLGWGYLEEVMTRQGAWKVRKEFEALGIDPLSIEFTKSSPAPYLGEVAKERSIVGATAGNILDREFPEVEEDGGGDREEEDS